MIYQFTFQQNRTKLKVRIFSLTFPQKLLS